MSQIYINLPANTVWMGDVLERTFKNVKYEYESNVQDFKDLTELITGDVIIFEPQRIEYCYNNNNKQASYYKTYDSQYGMDEYLQTKLCEIFSKKEQFIEELDKLYKTREPIIAPNNTIVNDPTQTQ